MIVELVNDYWIMLLFSVIVLWISLQIILETNPRWFETN